MPVNMDTRLDLGIPGELMDAVNPFNESSINMILLKCTLLNPCGATVLLGEYWTE